MKKIYSFITLLLMCFIGTANAQNEWHPVGGDETNVSEIQSGLDHFYVLKGGANTTVEGAPGKDVGGTQNYLSARSKSDVINYECVYNIIETGEMQGEHPVYILRNMSMDGYLTLDGTYSPYKAEAWKFTIQKGEYAEEPSVNTESGWDVFSKAVSVTRSQGAVEMGAWVFCDLKRMTYMCFYGNPAFAEYIDTNNWLIIPVEEGDAISEYDKFATTFDEYFSKAGLGSVEDIQATFQVGKNPGRVTQEFLDHVISVFNSSIDLLNDMNADPAVYKAASDAIVKLFEEELEEGVIPVSEGYYLLVNQRSQDMAYVNGNDNVVCQRGVSVPESWNVACTKYIWKVENSAEKGKFYFNNWGTGLYIGKNPGEYHTFQAISDTIAKVIPTHYAGDRFLLQGDNGKGDHQGYIHNDGAYNCVPWKATTDPNMWVFVPVDADTIAKLKDLVGQNILNTNLTNLVSKAQSDYKRLQFPTFVEGDSYNAPADSGLVTSVIKANSVQSNEGSIEALFDGRLNTYFHTAWDDGEIEPQGTVGKHWIKVDLGKELSELVIKFTKRQNAANGHVSAYALYAVADGDPESEDLGELVAQSVDSIEFQYGKNSTHIAKYKLSKPTRYLRFEVVSTRGNDSGTWDAMTAGTGPFWHMSEFRCYDPNDLKESPGFAAIPQELKDALNNALERASAELDAKKATQETIDALDKALEAFLDAYPDPTDLKDALDAASQMADNVEEGDAVGLFITGAKNELRTAINKLQDFVDAKEESGVAMTLEEIKSGLEELDAAIAVFNSKLIKPEGGKVYRIVSTAGYVLDEEGNRTTDDNGYEVEREQNASCIASVNADFYNGTPVWRYKTYDGVDEKFNTLWFVEKTDAGYSFKNLANGLYMNNPYEGLSKDSVEKAEIPAAVGYSKTPKFFNLEAYTANFYDAGSFLIAMGHGQFVNLQPTGNVVHWGDRNDQHAPFIFDEVTSEEGFSTSYKVDVEAGKTQIVSLPIEVSEVYTNAGTYYEVLGLNGDKIWLVTAEGKIDAGVPFIVVTEAAVSDEEPGEKFIDATLPFETLEENLSDLKYNYEPVVKNGLVSAPFGFTTTKEQAYGLLVNSSVIASAGGHQVVAGTGFFNSTIPVTEETGDVFIPVEGTISGEGTAVEKIEIVKNVPSDVYTISGVKVRQNVKIGVATDGLPKGIYIVGGKKVVVK